jgi:hypothetical protein
MFARVFKLTLHVSSTVAGHSRLAIGMGVRLPKQYVDAERTKQETAFARCIMVRNDCKKHDLPLHRDELQGFHES